MKLRLVSFESMGVRSMCALVRTPDVSILIDPSAACHGRDGLQPHPLEYEELIRKRAEILSLSKHVDVIVISHYHLDHLSPQRTDLKTTFSTRAFVNEVFHDKILFCKDPNAKITERQSLRGREFHRLYGGKATGYYIADGNSRRFGRTKITFSVALWHGREGTVQGYVVGTCIEDGDKTIVHASDVQLLNRGCVDWMIEQKPDMAITSGPPIFDPERMRNGEREIATRLLMKLTRSVRDVVVDHHLLRSPEWGDFLEDFSGHAECAAQAEGVSLMPLESERRSLYEREDAGNEFHGQLDEGQIPERLRSVIYEVGMESIYKAPLKG